MGLDRTYKELKQGNRTFSANCGEGLDRTYKELKLDDISESVHVVLSV